MAAPSPLRGRTKYEGQRVVFFSFVLCTLSFRTAGRPSRTLFPRRLTGEALMAVLQETAPQSLDTTALLNALSGLKKGDFTVRLPVEWTGTAGKVADTFNEVVELNQRMARELDRLSRVVGKEGKISQRASLGDVTGSRVDVVYR